MPPKAITLLFTQSLSILTAVWFSEPLPFAPECASRRFAPWSSRLSHEPCLLLVRTASTARPGRMPDGRLFLDGKGFGWYHKENQSDIVQSRDYLLKLVQRLGPKRPVIFAGFSQGGVMSIVTGLHCPNKVLAIVSMSGYVPNPAENLRDLKASRSVPILMVNGQMDETIPIADARFGETGLNAQGYHPVFKTLSMGHRISQESLNSVRDFLAQVLPKN